MNKKTTSHNVTTYVQIGMIIGQVNLVESLINDVIAQHYGDPSNEERRNRLSGDILYGGMVRLDDKLKLLKLVADANDIEMTGPIVKDFRQWKTIRNTVAHGIPMQNGENEIRIALNGELHDMDALRRGFGKRQDRITAFLALLKQQ